MNQGDIQRVVSVIMWAYVAIWSLYAAIRAGRIGRKTIMFSASVVSAMWLSFWLVTIGVSDDHGWVGWLFAVYQVFTAVAIGLMVHIASDMEKSEQELVGSWK